MKQINRKPKNINYSYLLIKIYFLIGYFYESIIKTRKIKIFKINFYKQLVILLFVVLLSSCGIGSRNTTSDPSSKESISSNPYDIVHFDATRAVLIRYGSPYAWLVDTTVSVDAEFREDKISLYSYDEADTVPEMMGGVAVSYTAPYTGIADYVVLGLQRLFRSNDGVWGVDNSAYLVVLNPDGTEFDTGLGGSKKGIELRVKNPYRRIFYDKYNNYIYVPGAGSLVFNNGTGGIDRVKLNGDGSFSFDDDPDGDTVDEYPLYKGHSITDLVVFSDNMGAIVEYLDWSNSCLRSFNAGLGELSSNPNCEANLGGTGVNIYALETWKDSSTGDDYLFVGASITDKDIDGGGNENGGYIFILDTSFNIIKKIAMPDAMNPSDITLQYSLDDSEDYLRIVVALSGLDWSSGGLGLITCDSGILNCTLFPSELKNATISDIAVSSYNKDFYLLERYQKDSISKFNLDNTDSNNYTPIWQFSTNE